MDDPDGPSALLELTVYLLSRTARLGKQALDEQLAARGLRLRHMAVLAGLAHGDSTSQLALGRHVRLDPSDVTATLDDLQQRGLVERAVDPADRRRRVVRLTDPGQQAWAELRELAAQVGDDLLAPLTSTRRAQLHQDLLAVLSAPRATEPPAGTLDRVR